MSSYGGLVIVLIFVVGFVALMCGIIGNAQNNSSRSRKDLTTKQLAKRVLDRIEAEEEEENYEMLWSEGGDMDDSL